MKFSIMLAIAAVVISNWCSIGYADRLYTWEDDKGVTHITKEPPPQKTKMIDTMDYTVPPAQVNQTTGKEVKNEGERKQPAQIGTQKRKEALEATGTTEDVDEDVDEDIYYDSDGGRYTRRAIRQERKEVRENRREKRRENRKGGDRPVRKIR
ncbi:MAG: DUF4124 domain-containing protein [Deltaproteobacteria bacterium]